MDTLWGVICAGVIQGATEFFPVSSSAHLALLRHVIPYHPTAAFDVMLHLGTFLAVFWFFRAQIGNYCLHLGHIFHIGCPTAHEIHCLVVASLPVMFSGLIVSAWGGDTWRDHVGWMGINSILFGLILGWADHGKRKTHRLDKLTIRHSLIIGAFQALAVIPGVSRSGACLTGLRFLGYQREDAVRWTFLLSLPSVGGAVVLKAPLLWQGWTMDLSSILGPIVAFAAGLGCIHLIFAWVKHHSFKAFVVYRIVLGVVLLGYGMYP